MAKTALLVARVSTESQAEKGYSLPTQLAGMKKYALAQGFTVAGEVKDEVSGTIPIYERPGGRKLHEAIKNRTVDAVVFYTIDRASRDEDVIDFIMLKRDLRIAGIELHFSDTGKSEFDSVTGIIEYIRVSEAGRERKKIIERNSRGKLAKAEAGKWVGTGHVPYGFRKIGKGRDAYLEIDKVEAALVQRIFAMYIGANGTKPLSFSGIARLFHEEGVPTPGKGKWHERGWHSGAVADLVNRRSNLGEFVYGGVTSIFPELALIDEETYNQAQKQKKVNTAYGKRNCKFDYLLRGRIFCVCNTRLTCDVNNKHKSPYPIYYCSKRSINRHLKLCSEKIVNGKKADAMIWDWLVSIFRYPKKMSIGLSDYANRQRVELLDKKARLAFLEDERPRTERRIKRLTDEIDNQEDDEVLAALRAKLKDVGKYRESVEREYSELSVRLDQVEMTHEKQAQILNWAAEINQGIDDGDVSFEAKRVLVDKLDVKTKIEYRGEQRGLFATCVLTYAAKWLPFGSGSSLTGRCPCRGLFPPVQSCAAPLLQ